MLILFAMTCRAQPLSHTDSLGLSFEERWYSPLIIRDVESILLTPTSPIIDDTTHRLPIVLSHGMGDNCQSKGMEDAVRSVAKLHPGVYVICIGDHGTSWVDPESPFEFFEDAFYGYLGSLNEAVEFFAAKVGEQEALKNGFNGVGFSQGNLILRGYLQRYQDPPLKTFLSVHGPLMGVGNLPECDPNVHYWCSPMFEILTLACYTPTLQAVSFQSNYIRNPLLIERYRTTDFLPDLNNEIPDDHPHKLRPASFYKENFESLEKLILVKADEEEMVVPSESEWFGFYQDGGYDSVWTTEETPWFKENWFGLKTIMDAGRVSFEKTTRNHCNLSADEFTHLMKYL